MGRTRTKSKLQRQVPPKTSATESSGSSSSSSTTPSISALISKAQSIIEQCDYDLASQFIRRILQKSPKNAEAREMLGVVQLETGLVQEARETFETLVPPHPDAPSTPKYTSHLHLAQLSDEDPHLALRHYQSALDILTAQNKGKERAVGSNSDPDLDADVKGTIVRVLISMVEIWMDPSYDLCFDPAAEQTCERLIRLALETDENNVEALQTLASVRLSQQRPDEARECVERAWNGWKDLDLDDPKVPSIPARLSLVKLFLELSLFNPALIALQGIMASDDQEVEAWYLEGWAFYLMAELAHDSPNGKLEGEGLTWEELAKDARDCLETCKNLHVAQEHADGPILEHVNELIGSLEAKGVRPTPEDERENGGWEDVEADSEDDDGDVDMS